MPLTPQAIKDRRASCTFTYAGESVTIGYRPGRITNNFSEEAFEAKQAEITRITTEEGEEAARHALAAWVLEYLASWDLVESVNDDGTPGPALALDVATLASLDPDFLSALLMAMFADIQAGKAIGTTPSAS